METTVKAIVSYRAGRDSRGRLIRSAIELETTVPVPATLRQIGDALALHILAERINRFQIDQVCIYHRGYFIGSLTPNQG